jgi:hypothetical protein
MAVIALAFCYSVTLAADASQYVLQTKEQALQRALEYSGFKESPGFVVPQADSCVKMMEIKDSTTPFLSDSISGAERWVVTFDSVFLDFGGWARETVMDQIRKSYHFVLDPSTGRLLTVYTTCEGVYVDAPPELSADSSAVLLSSNERHTSLVDSIPPVSFYEALDAAVPTNPLQAKEIRAWLVMFSYHGRDPIPCWIILGRGTAPFARPTPPRFGPEQYAPRLSNTCIRCVINAVTGKGLFCGGG